jgi:hypothetical protein
MSVPSPTPVPPLLPPRDPAQSPPAQRGLLYLFGNAFCVLVFFLLTWAGNILSNLDGYAAPSHILFMGLTGRGISYLVIMFVISILLTVKRRGDVAIGIFLGLGTFLLWLIGNFTR